MSKKNKLIFGVGINDANYVVKISRRHKLPSGAWKSKLVWQCPIYSSWKRMIERVHCKKTLMRRPSYEKVKICQDWYLFSNFQEWVLNLPYSIDGLSLDKDILSHADYKTYSPETCVFVSSAVNSFVLDFNAENAVRVRQRTENCFEARISNPILGKVETFYSNSPEDCSCWAKDKRIEIIKTLIDNEPDIRAREALYVKYLRGENNE